MTFFLKFFFPSFYCTPLVFQCRNKTTLANYKKTNHPRVRGSALVSGTASYDWAGTSGIK